MLENFMTPDDMIETHRTPLYLVSTHTMTSIPSNQGYLHIYVGYYFIVLYILASPT